MHGFELAGRQSGLLPAQGGQSGVQTVAQAARGSEMGQLKRDHKSKWPD
jgi:hypothetical protein